MSDTPLVSVIVPCYRQAHYLNSCLDSLFRQSYPAIEIVVVNDGSDDNIDEVVAPLLSKIMYVCQDNRGLPAARNVGIQNSTGDYLLFLDADDLLHPDAVRELVSHARLSNNSVTVMGHRPFVSEGTCDAAEPIVPKSDELALPVMLFKVTAPCHCHLVEKQHVLSIGGFDETLRSGEDWDLWLRLVVKGLIFSGIPFPGAYYRKHDGSMSTDQERMLENRTTILQKTTQTVLANEHLRNKNALPLYELLLIIRRHWIARNCPQQIVSIDKTLTQVKKAIRSARRVCFLPPLFLIDITDRARLWYYWLFKRRIYDYYRYRAG